MFPHPKRHVINVESKAQQLEIPGPKLLVSPTCSEEEALLVVLSHAQAWSVFLKSALQGRKQRMQQGTPESTWDVSSSVS